MPTRTTDPADDMFQAREAYENSGGPLLTGGPVSSKAAVPLSI